MSPQIILILMFSLSTLLIVLLFVIRRRKKKVPKAVAAQAPAAPALDLNLDELNLDSLFKESPAPESASSDLVELVRRYHFFQGNNLESFERLFFAKDFAGLEQLIKEKFEAQGKNTPELQAKMLTNKLLESIRT